MPWDTKAQMQQPEIFIAYRHDDSPDAAGRLADALRREFGDEAVFIDVSGPRGVDFRDKIAAALHSCVVVVWVIGRHWLRVQDESGRRRLDDPADTHARELATALERGISVVPVLMRGAEMPEQTALPEALKSLAFLTKIDLSVESWDYQVPQVVASISHVVRPSVDPSSHRVQPPPPLLATQKREEAIDDINRCIGEAMHVVIGGPPGIGKTRLLHSLRTSHPRAGHVRLGGSGAEAMRELRLGLHAHHGAGEFPLDDEAGISALRKAVPPGTLLLVDDADEPESVQAAQRVARFIDGLTVVVTSRRAHEFRGFRRLKLLRLRADEAANIIDGYALDATERSDVLRIVDGNPLRIRVLADAVKHGGTMDEEDDPLRSMINRWPVGERRVLWAIAELPSVIVAEELLIEIGGLTDTGMALLRNNGAVATVDADPAGCPTLLELHPTLRDACKQVLAAVAPAEQHQLRSAVATYYASWLRTRPPFEAIDMARGNLMHLMHVLDDHPLRAELALELIGDHREDRDGYLPADPNGYLPARGLWGLLVEPVLLARLQETAAQVADFPAAQILKNLGLFCHWANRPGAELLLLSARRLYERLEDADGSATTSWLLGLVAEETGQYSAAERRYGEPLSETDDRMTLAVSYHLLGCCLYRRDRFVEARDKFQRARSYADTDEMRARIDRRLDYVELAEDGYAPTILKRLQRSREKSIELNRPLDAARCLRHIGQGQLGLDDYTTAAKNLQQACREFENLGDQRGLGATLCALATTRRLQGAEDVAWALAERSRDIARGGSDDPTIPMLSPVGVARAERELGEIAEAAEDDETAIGHRRRACNIFQAIKHPQHRVLAARLGNRRNAPIPKPRGIIFDLVDTLAATHPDEYEKVKRQISDALGVEHSRFKAAWASSRTRASTDEHWTPADRIRWVASELGANLSLRQTAELAEHESRLWTETVEIQPETRGAVARLGERYAMVLVTNGSSAMRDLPDRLGLMPYLRGSLLSCEVGVLKPQPGIYLEALQMLGLPPEECIYVGDGSDRELEGAKAVDLFAVRMLTRKKPPYNNRESLDWHATVHSLTELESRMGEDRA